MRDTTTLHLLSGTNLVLDSVQTVILPEYYPDLRPGDTVVLLNEQSERLGMGLVSGIEHQPFANLQQTHFSRTAHPSLTSWGAAAEALRYLVPGFSISDFTTVIWIKTTALFEPALSIGAVKEPDPEEVTAPPLEELYEGLDKIGTGEGE